MPKELSQKQKKSILIALSVVVFLYIDFVYILDPQVKNLKSISRKLKTVRNDLADYKGYGLDAKTLQSDLEAIQQKSLAMDGMVFGEADMPLLLDDISRKANSCAVKILQINPQSQASAGTGKDNKKKTATPVPVVEISGFKLQAAELKIELSSGYHQLGKFLGQLEENPLIAVSDLKMFRDNLDSAKQKASLILRVYVKQK